MRSIRPDGGDGIALYRSSAAGNPAVGLVCTGFGVQRIRRWIVDRALDEFAIVFVDEGAGCLETAATASQRIVAPCLFVLRPGVAHSYGPDAGTTWHERWVLFGGPLTTDLVSSGLLDPAPIKLVEAAEVSELFGRLHRDFVDPGLFAPMAAAADLLQLIVRAASLGREQSPGIPLQDRLDDAIEALRRQAFERVDLVALSRAHGQAPATLRRHLQARLGLSPKAFIVRLRLSRAKELLAITGMSVAEVARAVGYDDPYYFARVFRAREKLTPSEFRRRNQRA